MEGLIAMIIASAGAVTAFALGYYIGRDIGYTTGMIAAIEEQIDEEENNDED